ncbi:MAG: DNA polymerase III subunit delta [Bacteroidales bacterium]|nr:DNA polymerase III subunit delta [Bacteroidales bacterium]
MQFKSIIGQNAIKEKLLTAIQENRVAHTQLFLGPEGSGVLALAVAYAQYINCHNKQNGDSCGVCPSCVKYEKLEHPDLQFVFPTATNSKITKEPDSLKFISEWKSYFIEQEGYVTQSGWYEYLDLGGNKQGSIFIRDGEHVVRNLSLKSYEGGYKVIIIYLPEKMNVQTANKLLKSLEEPPDQTIFLLVAERYELILPTIRSRAQMIRVPLIESEQLKNALTKKLGEQVDNQKVTRIAQMANGNWNAAIELLDQADENMFHFTKFREWMRLCYAGNDFYSINELVQEISRLGKEKQKQFIIYGLKVIQSSLMLNQQLNSKVMAVNAEMDYFTKFAPFINNANQAEMYNLMNEAVYELERNAHSAILFTHLSFQFIDLLRKGKMSGVKQ